MSTTHDTDTSIISHVRVFDGTSKTLSDPVDVHLAGGHIRRITPATAIAADKLHASGPQSTGHARPVSPTRPAQNDRVLIPGLIDSHVHVRTHKDLERLAHNGVTFCLDMAMWPAALMRELKETERVGLLSAGVPFIGPNGVHSKFVSPDYAVVTDPAQVPAGIERRLKEGSDYIKIVCEAPGDGGPSEEVVRAIVTHARERGVKTVAHAASSGAFELAARCGVDCLTHSPADFPVSVSRARELAERGVVTIPTVVTAKTTARIKKSDSFDTARKTARHLRMAGVPMFAGTDSVCVDPVPIIKHGRSLHDELELLVDAGLTPAETLIAATSAPARWFGLEDRGVIAEGARADLVLINGNPLTDISRTRNIDGVWLGGKRVR